MAGGRASRRFAAGIHESSQASRAVVWVTPSRWTSMPDRLLKFEIQLHGAQTRMHAYAPHPGRQCG